MKNSTRTGVNGARSHSERANITPVDRKILMFTIYLHLIEFYFINCTGNLVKNILYVYIHSVINGV
jgi:hypothetical protein